MISNFTEHTVWKYILKFSTLDNKNISEIRKFIYANENVIFYMFNIQYKGLPLHSKLYEDF